jgi:hypothetical protein
MVVVAGWIALNLAMVGLGRQPLDQPPFAWLELAISLATLFMTVLILSTQRRDDELASYREQLTLELAILGEQKSAKIIELIEELRRDDPTIRNRIDHGRSAGGLGCDQRFARWQGGSGRRGFFGDKGFRLVLSDPPMARTNEHRGPFERLLTSGSKV